MKKQKRNIIIAISIVLVLALGIFYFSSLQTYKTYFNDANLGMIEITAHKFNIFSPTQESYFTNVGSNALKQTGVVNQQIQVNEYYLPMVVDSLGGLYKAQMAISKDGSWTTYAPIDVTSAAKSVGSGGGIITAKFTPSQPGTYKASLVIFANNDKSKIVTETSSYSQEAIVISASTTPTCTLTPYYGSWTTKNTIDNGVIQERSFYKIDIVACSKSVGSVEDRIVCNSGYLVSGTSSTIADYTYQTCVKAQVVPDPECNVDLTESCSDGSIITIKKCSNGIYVDSGNKCSIVTPVVPNQTIITTPTNETQPGTHPVINDGLTVLPKDNTQLIAWIVVGVIVFLLIILTIKLVLNRRR